MGDFFELEAKKTKFAEVIKKKASVVKRSSKKKASKPASGSGWLEKLVNGMNSTWARMGFIVAIFSAGFAAGKYYEHNEQMKEQARMEREYGEKVIELQRQYIKEYIDFNNELNAIGHEQAK